MALCAMLWIYIAATLYGLMSFITLIVFGLDKHAARRKRQRTPERTLHTLSALGGWPGALIAMPLFKHKRRKAPFVRTVWVIMTLHFMAWGAILYAGWRF